MKKTVFTIIILMASLYQCQEPPEYPIEPHINFESFILYQSINSLNEKVITGQVNMSFTDGDGNVGFDPIPDTSAKDLPDSLKYNLFFQVYNYEDGAFVKVPEEDGGYLKYIIPYLDKQPLEGTISVTIEYPIITYDTIFYTFFLYDRELNRSNTDTTYVVDLSSIILTD